MLSKIKMLMGLAVVAIALPVNAATIENPAGFFNLTIDGGAKTKAGQVDVDAGGVNTTSGTFSGSDDWALNILPANTPSQLATLALYPSVGGEITHISLFESQDGGTSYVEVATSPALSISHDLIGAYDYFVRVFGFDGPDNDDTADYTLKAQVSAVPLPAAAWLFLSALAGYGLLGRRNSTQGAAIA